MQLFVLQEMQTSSFILNEAAFLCIMSYNLFSFLQPKTKRKSNQNVLNIACSCLMNSLHSIPPPVMLQQGQQGSDVALFLFSYPKARKATATNPVTVTVSVGYHDCYICLQIRGPFLPSSFVQTTPIKQYQWTTCGTRFYAL